MRVTSQRTAQSALPPMLQLGTQPALHSTFGPCLPRRLYTTPAGCLLAENAVVAADLPNRSLPYGGCCRAHLSVDFQSCLREICVHFVARGRNQPASALPAHPAAPALPAYLRYVLLNPFLAFVTVNVPSSFATILIQYAVPLCAGGGAAPGPGAGAAAGATGRAAG